MTLPQAIAVLLTLAALAAYANRRLLHLPATIGMMAIALVGSLLLLLAARYTGLAGRTLEEIRHIDFGTVVLDAMLPYLLFAGALQVDLRQVRHQALPVGLLASVGVVLSALVAGTLLWMAANGLGVGLGFPQALLFGALIAPTDPVAVLGVLRGANAPAPMQALMAGESLFNDGMGIVLFLTLFGIAVRGEPAQPGSIALDLLREAGGGILFGLALGWLGCRMLRTIDNYPLEIFLTLALAAGGYAAAGALGFSGPLTTVSSGVVIATAGRRSGMSEKTRAQLDDFWELVDQMLNAVLFVLVGMEMVVIAHDALHLILAATAILAVLVARWVSVAGILGALQPWRRQPRGTVTILTWGGVRGAISISLALALPAGDLRDTLVTATYVVVAFSVIVQGLSLGRLVRRYAG
ncbi:MAG TPA: sodium:proton antiporter [Usitatibacter sp.]